MSSLLHSYFRLYTLKSWIFNIHLRLLFYKKMENQPEGILILPILQIQINQCRHILTYGLIVYVAIGVSAEAGKINRHNIPINGKYYDISDAEGFDEIETAFVKTLNSVGVEITKQSLNYMLL